ncbi:Glucokinase [subsurface metagenome]|nr:ROK family protein [Bacillota bacterium]
MNKYSIGIDIGGTNVTVALVTEKGKIVRKIRFPTKVEEGKTKTIKRIVKALDEIMKGLRSNSIEGIGIGAAGDIDQNRGIVRFSPNLFWKNVPIVHLIRKRFNLKVVVDNDANAAAWGTYILETKRKVKNLLCITLGTGVGGGLILNGRIYHGASGSAGEIGHITLNAQGEKCRCGNYGCLETYVGSAYMVKKVIKEIRKGERSLIKKLAGGNLQSITSQTIQTAALKGDKLARRIWKEAGEYLGIALSGVINLLNPEVIVFGGGVAKAEELIFQPMKKEIRKRTFRVPFEKVKFTHTKFGADLGVIGAALLTLQGNRK